jgi:acyl-CoA thioester hydrolase
MKPPAITVEQVKQLDEMMRLVIPPTFEDENGHMNVRHYLTVFDDAGYPMVASFGLTPEFHTKYGTGGFDLEHHMHFLNEVHIGDEVVVYLRIISRSSKRIHYMLFMVNETRQKVAAIFECVNSFADLKQRKTAPYPVEIASKIDTTVERHNKIEWVAPVCGIMSA